MFMFAGHLDMSQLPHALMSNIQPPGERILISAADVLAEAQMSQFLNPNLDPYAVPEPSAVALLIVGLFGVSARWGGSGGNEPSEPEQPHRRRAPGTRTATISRPTAA